MCIKWGRSCDEKAAYYRAVEYVSGHIGIRKEVKIAVANLSLLFPSFWVFELQLKKLKVS